ncbi:recombinase family protein [Paracraurococcus lichenis]|uniref:Uncharacterized protein n=1 Tax=Paracraurococcus lichenis TaxID=3064888 RepID=A0ABT9ECN8_9PROT|nr:hypothetical protein [Paracraurococcus sp. LOR1-02]MDO9713977.1 hypothetical protein [Paracraurococcus sp. LOR1-02]
MEGEGDDCHGWCEVVRRGHPPVRRTFSVADAKRVRLWGKTGANGPTPWVTYPARMLMSRARGFAIRDAFADALRGVITVEEAADMPPEPRDVPNLAAAQAPTAAVPAVVVPVPPTSAVADAAGDAAPGNDNEVLDWLRDERDQGAAVESVEGLFVEALGADAVTG